MRLRNNPVDSSGSFPCTLTSADVHEEPEQERAADRHQHQHEQHVAVGEEDPEDDEEHPDRRQDRANHVERARGVRGTGSTIRRLRRMIATTTAAWKEERGAPTDRGCDQTPINGPAAAPTPPSPLMTPNARARDVTLLNAIVVRM